MKPVRFMQRWVGDHKSLLFILACMAVIALKAGLPKDWESWNSNGLRWVAIVPNWVHWVLTIWMLASALCMLVWAVVADQHGLIRIIVAALAIVLPPAALFLSFLFNLGPWTIEATTVGPDSKTYSFLDTNFLQGQVMAIANESHDWVVLREFHVIGWNNGDSPRSWASVIRPAGAPDDYGQFYWSKDGQLIAIRRDDQCFMAYTPSTDTFLGHDKIETLSPFVLIDSRTSLHAPDVQEISHRLTLRPNTGPGCPTITSLQQAADHPNPEVRRLAALWIARLSNPGTQ